MVSIINSFSSKTQVEPVILYYFFLKVNCVVYDEINIGTS